MGIYRTKLEVRELKKLERDQKKETRKKKDETYNEMVGMKINENTCKV